MPIGKGAKYVFADIAASGAAGMTQDEDIIIMRPDAPLADIRASNAGWDNSRDRCIPTGGLLGRIPLPLDYIVGNGLPGTPNSGFAALLQDGRTILQGQPLARCASGSVATSLWAGRAVDIFGAGIEGAHGGSMMSTIGGTLRLGELRPGGARVRHAVKINLWAQKELWRCQSASDCFRWPALQADSYAVGSYGTKGTNPSALKMGALLALPQSLDLASLDLKTEPARQLAWTLQHFGGYVVDDTFWDVYAFSVEHGPDGNFDDQFKQDWGYEFHMDEKQHPWAQDMAKIFTKLHVVNNNSPQSIGGGGTPIEHLAPNFK
jgi:hypothetical protein